MTQGDALKAFEKMYGEIDKENWLFIGTINLQMIEHAIKALSIIRCKDCKYYTGKWCTRFSAKQFDINDICKSNDDFCSMAERKRGNNYETNR